MRRSTTSPTPSPATLSPVLWLPASSSRASAAVPASTTLWRSLTPSLMRMHHVALLLAPSSLSSAAVGALVRQPRSLRSLRPVMCMVHGSMASLRLGGLILH
uniref:Uncharacterized protein n=1 Tax=Arundo donax TaxID=35708 RepID=A0A0A9DPS7_ARUDO